MLEMMFREREEEDALAKGSRCFSLILVSCETLQFYSLLTTHIQYSLHQHPLVKQDSALIDVLPILNGLIIQTAAIVHHFRHCCKQNTRHHLTFDLLLVSNEPTSPPEQRCLYIRARLQW